MSKLMPFLRVLVVLSGCGNTVRGLKQDGVQTSHALDDATHRVAKADAPPRKPARISGVR